MTGRPKTAGKGGSSEGDAPGYKKLVGYVLFWIDRKIEETKKGEPVDENDLDVLKATILDYMAAYPSGHAGVTGSPSEPAP